MLFLVNVTPVLNNYLQCYICGIDKRNTCINLDFSGRLDFSAPTTDYDACINQFKQKCFQSSIFSFLDVREFREFLAWESMFRQVWRAQGSGRVFGFLANKETEMEKLWTGTDSASATESTVLSTGKPVPCGRKRWFGTCLFKGGFCYVLFCLFFNSVDACAGVRAGLWSFWRLVLMDK